MKHQHGKKTMRCACRERMWSTSMERRPCDACARRERMWSTSMERRPCDACASRERMWSTSMERRPCDACASRERMWSTSMERRPCDACARRERMWSISRERRPSRACFLQIFSSGGHFLQPSGTILAILVKRHKRNISVKLFWNRLLALEEMSFIGFFLFQFWQPFCSAEQNHFSNFGKGA